MMASAKTKKDRRLLALKVVKNRLSRDFQGESKDLRLGIERRKFSYTFCIPERRSNQNRNKLESTILSSKQKTKG
jgi:hypothetical protein